METNKSMGTDEIIATNEEKEKKGPPAFKKPVLIGKIGRFPRKVTAKVTETETKQEEIVEVESKKEENEEIAQQSNCEMVEKSAKEVPLVLPYKEPSWGGAPESSGDDYCFDVLKAGSILETINLMKKSFWVFGRLETCDVFMQHPTVSRYHAVLQYRSDITEDNEPGFYIYDLGSTHGTFLNKQRLKPRIYVKVSVGHMIKLGCSSRMFILNGPADDAEEESKFTVTELKQKHKEDLKKREEAAIKEKLDREEKKRKEEERGVDWGMGADADEETDLTENPFAQTNNEELYIDDPKKALRGFMEREGLDLEYDCSEQGMGQFLCKVMLPLDDERGRPVYAEVLHKGKKKEAVVQCALEACRMLDRYGVLRQATHESHKRKTRNWEENDYYDSDEDTFLDRTGTIEKKREGRMKVKGPQRVETYQSLMEKEKSISLKIRKIMDQLSETEKRKDWEKLAAEEDSLDSYMNELHQSKMDKMSAFKLKSELTKLKTEHANVIKLVNIAKPADLPPLVSQYSTQSELNANARSKMLPIFGKRKKIKVQLPSNTKSHDKVSVNDNNLGEEKDSDDEGDKNQKPSTQEEPATQNPTTDPETNARTEEREASHKLITKLLQKILQEISTSSVVDKECVMSVQTSFEKLNSKGQMSSINWNSLDERLQTLERLITENADFADELRMLANDLEKLTPENCVRVKFGIKRGTEIEVSEEESAEELERKKRKNQRRIQQRENRATVEKVKGYKEDAKKEDYNMWVPPNDQSGDGRTGLNDKFGY